ncbi:DUF4145 domain-containing protein [Nocardia neocaledoniensis]|uniref:DUF4145 domain-containing protein n=1 Tax=Nocardia neocaledoniensis TaxID=236511 RepID=UPI00245486DC|nr:DUF4145 domain-containing protein [Nocardia neocaledoniensis]
MRAQIRQLAEPFSERDWPTLTCPTCGEGALNVGKFTYEDHTTEESPDPYDGDPTAPQGRFHGHLICNRSRCGAWVAVSGTYKTDYELTIRGGEDYLDLWANVSVRTLLPAPLIIELTSTVPEPVVTEIRRASALVWLDPQAAVGALRSAVERVMDDHGIPKRKPTGGRIDLHARLETFEQTMPDTGALLMATKWVGNSGVHDPSLISVAEALNTAEIIETALRDLYPMDDSEIRTRAAQINLDKGLRREPPSNGTSDS